MENEKFKIVTAQSSIDWKSRKVTGAHNGTLAVKEGKIVLNDDQLAGGENVVDSASIKILDITDPAINLQFEGHTASDDLFCTRKIS